MKRRTVMTTAGAVLASATSQAHAAGKRPIVLVHGAGHGGWCWRDVRTALQQRGFNVFTPTLTGLGERVHLRSPNIRLSTHIADVVNVIEFEDLTDVVLVGHSYAGMVVTGVCDAVKSRIGHMIIIDGAIPEDGEPSFPGTTAEALAQRFGALKDGYLVTMNLPGLGFPDPETEQARWVKKHLTEHLIQTWSDTIALPNGGSRGVPRTYVQCADVSKMAPAGQAKVGKVKNSATWAYVEKIGPHDVMVTDPKWTADLIAERARQS